MKIIIVGGGHNGLVSAAYLSRLGHAVTVLERRNQIGGSCITEELIPGARFSSCAFVVSSLRPQIIRELELKRHGLDLYTTDTLNFAMVGDEHVFIWPEIDRTLNELKRIGEPRPAEFLEFGVRFRRFSKFIEPHLLSEPPALGGLITEFDAAGETELWHEWVSRSVDQAVGHYFKTDLAKGLFSFFGLVSGYAGPETPTTAYSFSHHSWGEHEGEFGRFGFARGGMGSITQALARSAEEAGAEIHTDAEVIRITIGARGVKGVILADGTSVPADIVLSNVDVHRTFQRLLDERDVPSAALERVAGIDVRGTMARVHLLIDELPQYRGFDAGEGAQHRGFTLLGGTTDAYQRSWEAQQRGELLERYPIEIIIQSVTDDSLAPAGMHTLTTGVQQLPFELRNGDWDNRREEFTERVIASIAEYAPNLPAAIKGVATITPADLQRTYGLTGGNIFQGALSLDQLFASRAFGGYRTPIRGLYLCGAATHPAGAVTGAPGYNAAKAVQLDVGGTRAVQRSRPRRRFDAVDRISSSKRMRPIRDWSARQPLLRPIMKLARRL